MNINKDYTEMELIEQISRLSAKLLAMCHMLGDDKYDMCIALAGGFLHNVPKEKRDQFFATYDEVREQVNDKILDYFEENE